MSSVRNFVGELEQAESASSGDGLRAISDPELADDVAHMLPSGG